MRMKDFIQNSYVNKVIEYVKRAKELGMVEYVFSDVFQKAMVFIGGFIVVRILSKEEYGSYTYLVNLLSIFTLFGDFGISSAALQFGSINYANFDKKNAYIRYANKMLNRISIISILLVLFGSYLYRFDIEGVSGLFRLMMFLPLLNNEITFFGCVLRIELKNREYAIINIINTALHYLALISLSIIWGVNGAIVAFYPQNIIVIVIYLWTLKFQRQRVTSEKLTKNDKKRFWKFAILMQVNQTSLALLNYLDIYCLGSVVKKPDVIAEYKVASTIPTALYFIPKSIMFFLVPIMGRKRDDLLWIKNNVKKTIIANSVICGITSIFFALSSSLLIRVIYGERYINATSCFVVLLVGFFFYGVFQVPSSNVLSIFEKLKVVLIISVCGALLNIFLNIVLISAIGSVGAAIATVASHLFIGIILTAYMVIYFRKAINCECKMASEYATGQIEVKQKEN